MKHGVKRNTVNWLAIENGFYSCPLRHAVSQPGVSGCLFQNNGGPCLTWVKLNSLLRAVGLIGIGEAGDIGKFYCVGLTAVKDIVFAAALFRLGCNAWIDRDPVTLGQNR